MDDFDPLPIDSIVLARPQKRKENKTKQKKKQTNKQTKQK